jgi:hypothetical protein
MGEYFYSIPIYNLTENEYYDKYEKKKSDYIEKYCKSNTETIKVRLSEYFDLKYRKPWFHNDIIGWIRFYMLGSQLRGEIFYQCIDKVGNHLNKRIESSFYCPTFIDLSFDDVASSDLILNEINLKLLDVQKDNTIFPIKNFYIDLTEFNRISKFIDWKSLLKEYSMRYYDSIPK